MLHGRVECPKCGDIKRNCICADHTAFVTYVECANCTLMASRPLDAISLKKQILEAIDLDIELVRPQTSFEALLLRKLKRIEEILGSL